MQLQV